jgi:putative transposase
MAEYCVEQARKHSVEQIMNLLEQIEVGVVNGKIMPLARREAGITDQTTYDCWRKEYGGLQTDQARRLEELEQENTRLKRIV